MARLQLSGNRSADIAVKMDLEAGARPDLVLRMEAANGAEANLVFEYHEALNIAAALFKDPRFKIGGRPGKPAPELQGELDELLNRVKGS